LTRYVPDPGEDDHGTPCACGRRCAEADYQGNPKPCPRAFCQTDQDWIGRAVRWLPEAYASLALMLPRADQAGERVSGSREAPIPVAPEVEALMREIVLTACSWEDQVRAVARLSDYPEVPEAALEWGVADGGRRDGRALADACRTLCGHLDALLSAEPEPKVRPVTPQRLADLAESDPDMVLRFDASGDAWEDREMDGTDAGMELLALAGRARGMLGLNRRRRRITEVPCDGYGCGALTLVQHEAREGGWEEVVKCTACPQSYAGTQFTLLMARIYQAQIGALEAEHRRRVNVAA
jgi:hypothetical protein